MVNYNDPMMEVMIGQSEPTPADTEDSVWIMLPDQEESVDNMAGEGKGLHTMLGNNVRYSLQQEFDLSGTTNPVLTFDTYFDIEADWDYVYVRISTDDGATWTNLFNDEGVYATMDPFSSLAWLGEGGLTGMYEGSLTYNLSAHAGASSAWIQFMYATDAGVQNPGLWLDNIAISEVGYASDLEDTSDWMNDGWEEVPYLISFPHMYMLEWRNDDGSIAQQGHMYNYYSLAHDGDGWMVDIPI
jgi:immune inhibitor A